MSLHELELRFGDALMVSTHDEIHKEFFANNKSKEVAIYYHDNKTGLEFILDPAPFLAMDAWKHPVPYFEAALNGKTNPFKIAPPSDLVTA